MSINLVILLPSIDWHRILNFKRWETREGQRVLLTYLLTHPWSTIAEPLEHAPQIMTMNPDYGWTAALPQWASTILYGDFASALAPNLPSGPPRSSDPLYFLSLLAIGAVLFVFVVFKRQRRSQFNVSVWVAVWTLGFVAIWAVEIWNLAAGDLAREFIVAGVVSHIALILLIMGCVDSLMSSSLSRKTWRAGRSAGEARYDVSYLIEHAGLALRRTCVWSRDRDNAKVAAAPPSVPATALQSFGWARYDMS